MTVPGEPVIVTCLRNERYSERASGKVGAQASQDG
jgi:hypothetical protein